MKNLYKTLYLTLVLSLVSVMSQAQEVPVTWTDLVGVSVNNGNLKKTASNGASNGGAASNESLSPGEDGAVFFTVHAEQFLYFGMSSINQDASKNTINYSFLLKNSNLQIRENGTRMATISGGYAVGDKLKIERNGTSITYLKNDEIVYTSATPSSGSLLVDVSIINQNHEIRDAMIFSGTVGQPPIPNAPDNLTLGTVSSSSISFSWNDNSDNESGFLIQRSQGDANNFSNLTTIGANNNNTVSFTDNGLPSGTPFYYKVASVNGPSVISSYSNIISSTTTEAIPNAPSNLAVVASGNTLSLSWDDNSNNETAFQIERSDNSSSNFTLLTSVTSSSTSYYDNTVLTDNIYHYRVSAVNVAGTSFPSNTASGQLPDVPSPPSNDDVIWTNLIGVSVNTDNVLTKTAANGTNNGGASSEQILEEGIDGGTSFTVHGIVNLYYGLSDEDINASKNTIDYSFLLRSSGALQVRENGQHRLTVGTYSANDVLSIVRNGQVVEYLRNDEVVYTSQVLNTTDLMVDVSITDQGDEIRNAIIFENNGGSTVNAPSNLRLTSITSNSVSITWDDQSDDETGFSILRSLVSGGLYAQIGTVGENVTSFSHSGAQVIDGTKYYYVVKSLKNTESSDPSNELMAITLLDAPTSLSVSNTTTDAITLNWTDNSTTERSFRIERSITSTGSFSPIGAVTTDVTSFRHDGLSVGETNFYRVIAENDETESMPSNFISATTQSSPPLVPTGFTVVVLGANSLQLDWSAIGTETSFEIERWDESLSNFEVIHTSSATDRSFSDQGLVPENTYRYRIRAERGGLFSPYTAEVSATTLADLTPDTDLDQTLQYNGNISAVKWQSHNSDVEKLYTYHYDPMNRINSADYAEKSTTDTWTDRQGAFKVHGITYDLNGNIKTLNRQESNVTGVQVIDQLTYDYGGTGNQLQSVEDIATSVGFRNGYIATIGNEDYDYDNNGNLILDRNKNIESITYNHLNLPERVIKNDGKYILYGYDAAGIKLFQEVRNADNSLVKRTDYVGEYIYETEGATGTAELQLIQHEEGRIVPGTTNAWDYQYHLKDHLGNTRLTFTTKSNTIDFEATMESENATDEEALFSNVAETRVPFNSADANADGGNEVVRLNGTQLMGPGISLPVGKGDKLDMEAYGYYEGGNGYSTQAGLTTFISAVAGGFGGINGGTEVQQATYNAFDNALGAIGLNGTTADNRPAAYLNYILFDQNMVYYQHGHSQISTAANGSHERISLENIEVEKTGYVYIYLSNESVALNWVYFDDLKVTLTEHPVVQEDDYYPFGLTHSNGYQRVTAAKNDFLNTGKERITDLDLNWDDFGARIYMPDIARWNAIDPMAHKYDVVSPYNYTLNNPILFIDPDGRDVIFSGVTQKELDVLRKIIDQGLQGQFKAKFSNVKGAEKGTLSLTLVATKGGGDLSKLTDEGNAFYNHLNDAITDKENNTQVEVVFGEAGVKVGKYATNQLDIADIDQFNEGGSDVDYSAPTGATKQGKLVHEIVEQHEKAKGRSQNSSHESGSRAEGEVNGNQRMGRRYKNGDWVDSNFANGNSSIVQSFREKDGSKTTVIYKHTSGIIKVQQRKPRGLPRKK